MKRLAVVMLLVAASPVSAQHIELTPLASYTTQADLDQTAAGVSDLTIGRGFTWGGQATYFVSSRVGLELLWTHQSTAISMTTSTGTAELFDMTANQFHGNVVYQFRGPEVLVTPFVFGGFGMTLLNASHLPRETKASWTVGGGVKWFLQRHVGLKLQARYKPTALNDSSASICDPFGFCQDSLQHFEFAGGAVFRF